MSMPARADIANVLTMDEPRPVALNIANCRDAAKAHCLGIFSQAKL